jgi:hypothetical protein
MSKKYVVKDYSETQAFSIRYFSYSLILKARKCSVIQCIPNLKHAEGRHQISKSPPNIIFKAMENQIG